MRSKLDGRLRWLLNAGDLCELFELAADLLPHWGATTPLQAWMRTAALLGAEPPTEEEQEDSR
jgi:hypothetical protein